MLWSQRLLATCCVLVLLSSFGCYSPYGYGGYPGPYGTYPGSVVPPDSVAPGTTYQQGTQLLPPQGFPTPATAAAPNAEVEPKRSATHDGVPTGAYDNDPNTVQESGAAPTGNGEGQEFAPFSVNDELPRQELQALPPIEQTTAADVARVDGSEFEGVQQASFELEVVRPKQAASESNVEQASAIAVDEGPVLGAEPARLETAFAKAIPPSAPALEEPAQRVPSPYAFDENYKWLQGVAYQDPQDSKWYVMFSENPKATDRFGGEIMLIDHPTLSQIREEDVVLVQGTVDKTVTDRFGKPGYRIREITPMVPESARAPAIVEKP